MKPFHVSMREYKKQMKQGTIRQAYKGLMEYIMGLRTYFQCKYPDYFVSGSIYYGYMDMTYFSISPKSFRNRNLKIAIVFLHEAFRFEAWLAGVNKRIQARYWKLFTESSWDQYRIVSTTKGSDAIVECILTEDPDFSDIDALTGLIDATTRKFIMDIEGFLAAHEDRV